eukprot:gb/GFBE01016792.1/.p1 GENE.gb/GFBE01016792.1/~~gb/GFBE01016792.1/.p1  ORF type:complete len:546 (+),score=126.17 gb/GFBE01016792.1/:1-1638(+)
MSAVLIVAALLGQVASASHIFPEAADGISLMQRLRGTKTSVTSVVLPSADDGTMVIEKSSAPKMISGQRYSHDDESCSAEGITPGVCALASLARPPAPVAKHVRGAAAADCDERESSERLERALIAEIDAGLAGSHAAYDDTRIQALEEELQPLFATLPHEEEAGLGLSSARFLLHQHFLRQHSWYVRGLNPAGDGRQPPDHKEALRSRVAGHLLEVLESRVGKQGLNLRTLAVFVATLEHLLHGDERQRLKAAWDVHDLSAEDVTDGAGVRSVIEVFMAHYVYTSQKVDSGYALTLEKGRQEVAFVSRTHGAWKRLIAFVDREVAQRVKTDFSFEDAAQVAAEVLQYFNDVSGSMCADMVATFTALPGAHDGRASLEAMRRSGDLVRESVEYLRSAGALDESDAQDPQVILPNYMLSASNCDGTTSFYDLCCPNQCEGHKSHLERALAAAPAGQRLAALKAAVEAKLLGRVVPDDLSKQLDAIAQDNNGDIPLHGLDFARWLHAAMPRDCPRPAADDFHGEGGAVPDAGTEYQATAKVESLFDW